MRNPFFVQSVGLVALLIAVSIYQTNTRKIMLMLGMSACLFWSAHFLLLGAVTGAAMNLLSATRAYVYYRIEPSKKNRWVMWAFLGAFLLATTLTWQGLISLLPLLGSGSNVVAYWWREPRAIRRFALASPPPWLVHNVISGSYPGIAVEVLKMTSNLVGQYRFDIRPAIRRKLLRVNEVS